MTLSDHPSGWEDPVVVELKLINQKLDSLNGKQWLLIAALIAAVTGLKLLGLS